MRLLLALVLLQALPAKGDEGEQQRETARAHFVAGTSYYDENRYQEALHEFEEAYRLSSRPALLYNIGRCQEQLGRRDAAIDAYEKYLVAAADASERAEVKQRIDRLRAEPRTPPPPDAGAPPDAGPPPDAGKLAPVSAATAMRVDLTQPAPPRRPVYKRGWFWAVIASSAVVVAGAIIVGVVVGGGSGSGIRTLPEVNAQ